MLSHAASALKGRRPDRKIPFPNPKNLGGGNLKNNAKGFSGGAQRAGLPARRRAGIRLFPGNRFELRCR